MSTHSKTFFAPELFIPRATHDISFYTKAFDAKELRRWANDDGSIHVAEFSIDGAIFYIHEETADNGLFSPARHKGSTALIGLFVPDVDKFIERAIQNGAKLITPAQSYDYGYRQGVIEDQFGHDRNANLTTRVARS
jgi:PhnB protein